MATMKPLPPGRMGCSLKGGTGLPDRSLPLSQDREGQAGAEAHPREALCALEYELEERGPTSGTRSLMGCHPTRCGDNRRDYSASPSLFEEQPNCQPLSPFDCPAATSVLLEARSCRGQGDKQRQMGKETGVEELWEQGPFHFGPCFPEESLSQAPKRTCILPTSCPHPWESGHTVAQTPGLCWSLASLEQSRNRLLHTRPWFACLPFPPQGISLFTSVPPFNFLFFSTQLMLGG